MFAIALALGASVAWGSSDFIAGVKTRQLAVLPVMLVSQAAGLLAVAAAVVLGGTAAPGGESVAWAMVAGGAEAVGFTALYRGLAVGTMSLVAPISASAAVVPLAVDVAAGAPLHRLQLLGIGAVVVGVAMVACKRREAAERNAREKRGVRVATGVGLGLVAALGFGGFFVAMDLATHHDALWPVAINRATALGLLGIAALATRAHIRVRPGDLRSLAGLGLLDILANVLFALALTKGLVSVVAVLASLYPVTTVVLAQLVLRERTTAYQGIGALAALVGVATITAVN